MEMQEQNEYLWQEILSRAGQTFETHKGGVFTYHIKPDRSGETSGDLVIDGKRITITRSTILLAYHRTLEVQAKHGCVSKPGKIGVYGDIWLYPVFLDIGICTKTVQAEETCLPNRHDPEHTADGPAAESPAGDGRQTCTPVNGIAAESPAGDGRQTCTPADGPAAESPAGDGRQTCTPVNGIAAESPAGDGRQASAPVIMCRHCGYATADFEDLRYCPKCGKKYRNSRKKR